MTLYQCEGTSAEINCEENNVGFLMASYVDLM